MPSNDNDSGNIVSFRPKKITVQADIVANVFVKDGLIGLMIKDGIIFLPPDGAMELALVLAAAIKAALNFRE